MPSASPIRYGKRVNIKRQTYEEMMTLNKITESADNSRKDSEAGGNFARAFAMVQKINQSKNASLSKTMTLGMDHHRKATTKAAATGMAGTARQQNDTEDDMADYILVGKQAKNNPGVIASTTTN